MIIKAVDRSRLEADGFAFARGSTLRDALGIGDSEWAALLKHWDDLGPDNYLGTDYMFRLRRFAQLEFEPASGQIRPLEDSTFLQSVDLNRHAGGVVRTFEPIQASALESDALHKVLTGSFDIFEVPAELYGRTWRIDVNFFRIRVDGPNCFSPTPEGIHRDGYPFGVIAVVQRHNIQGGISHVYSLENEFVTARLLGDESLDSLYAYDTRMKHYTTPIFSCDGQEGYRDLLGFVYYLPGSPYDREH